MPPDTPSLQSKIDSTKKGDKLIIPFGEFHEQVVIKKNLSLIASTHSITIAGDSPTILIKSPDVELKNIEVICQESDGIAIESRNGTPKFDNVFVKGRTVGFDEGVWEIPENTLEMIASCSIPVVNKIFVLVPVDCTLETDPHSDVKVKTKKLFRGLNEVIFEVNELHPSNFIYHEIILQQKSGLKRRIPFTVHPKKDLGEEQKEFLIWQAPTTTRYLEILNSLRTLPEGILNEEYNINISSYIRSGNQVDINLNENCGFSVEKRLNNLILHGKILQDKNIIIDAEISIDGNRFRTNLEIPVTQKKLNPLIVEYPDLDNISLKEKTHFDLKCQVISSNSPSIDFKLLSDSNPNIQINPVNGQIYGSFDSYGIYELEVMVSDGSVSQKKAISLTVFPEKDLFIDLPASFKMTPNQSAKIKIEIAEAERLAPVITFNNSNTDVKIKLINEAGDNFLEVNSSQSCNDVIKINVLDKFQRTCMGTTQLIISEEPIYDIEWIDNQIKPEPGSLNTFFEHALKLSVTEQMGDQVNPVSAKRLDFKLLHTDDSSFTVSKDGVIHGKRSSREVIMEIRVKIAETFIDQRIIIVPQGHGTNSTKTIDTSKVKDTFGKFRKSGEQSNNQMEESKDVSVQKRQGGIFSVNRPIVEKSNSEPINKLDTDPSLSPAELKSENDLKSPVKSATLGNAFKRNNKGE